MQLTSMTQNLLMKFRSEAEAPIWVRICKTNNKWYCSTRLTPSIHARLYVPGALDFASLLKAWSPLIAYLHKEHEINQYKIENTNLLGRGYFRTTTPKFMPHYWEQWTLHFKINWATQHFKTKLYILNKFPNYI
jgi:hypothetical protein